ncbi:MAG: glycosyltransferase family 2 protein [Desulfitobacteriaceae bacterium]|nr:glycosyltransferase family 2 protein [Desulfitobacteriaceae bacterium]
MISVIIPVFNSERSLAELYLRLMNTLIHCSDDWEIIMVDDASLDKSYDQMQSLHSQDARVKIIRLAVNAGQHQATLCGMNYSKGDYIITIDDDLQHPPEEIPLLLTRIQMGYDVVFGIPQQKQHKLYRNLGSMVVDKAINLIYPDSHGIKRSSFRILTADLVKHMVSSALPPVYMAALILQNAKKPDHVEVRHDSRKYGKSNYCLKKSLAMVRILLIQYSYLPLQYMSVCWKAAFIFTIMLFIFIDIAAEAAIMSFILNIYLLIIAGLCIISWWIVQEYLQRLQRDSNETEIPYIIGDIEF